MTFHASAQRVQREHPAWSYSQVCAELQRRSVLARKRRKSAAQPKPAAVYWWQKE
jgi:hypothetical protein